MNLLRNICIMTLATICLVASEASVADNLTPDEALVMLRQGNARFASGRPTHPNSGKARITETATDGQHPFATLITCSDSRVPVERVFDLGIGDIFVIRVVGNVCAVDEIGSIEYGVDHLGTPLMVVLGHTGCGAVTAVATGAELHGSIPALVDNIIPAVERAEKYTGLKGSAVVPAAVKENVWQSISDLLTGSPTTARLAGAQQLKVVGAVYDITDGKVEWLGEHPGQSSLVAGGSPVTVEDHGEGHGTGEGNDGPAVDASKGADDNAGHSEEAEDGAAADNSDLKTLLALSMSKVNSMLMLIVIGMCILGLGLGLLAIQNIQLKIPTVPLPKKKKKKAPAPEPQAQPADETADEPAEVD